MSKAVDIGRVQAALRASISKWQRPTQAQVLEISQMTYNDDALKEILTMIHRRVKHADWYTPAEIYHTLVLIQDCLATGSRKFVAFCATLVPIISGLKHYELTGIPVFKELSERIRGKAESLCRDLASPARLPKERHVQFAQEATTITLPSLEVQNSSPRPLAKKAFSNVLLRPRKRKNRMNRDQSAKVPVYSYESLLHWDIEEVARRTFMTEELDSMLQVLDKILGVNNSQRSNPDALSKALTIVCHCLVFGSDAFANHFEGIRPTLNLLRRHYMPSIRSLVQKVLDLLNVGLKQEKTTRKTQVLGPGPVDLSNNVPGPVDLSNNVLCSRLLRDGFNYKIWGGIYTTGSRARIVSIKILHRLNKGPTELFNERRNRELRAWHSAQHENIATFYGIITNTEGKIGMVWPYYIEGNIVEYLKRNPKTDPLPMIHGIAEGVAYLHDQQIVHGDLKGSNIMISHKSPKLIDFGLVQFIESARTDYTAPRLAISPRWSAPELLSSGSVTSRTEKSDIYAFASLCIEIVTLRVPYHDKSDLQVTEHVLAGGIPDRPSVKATWSPSDELWEFLQQCWRKKPQDRPKTAALTRELAEFYTYAPFGS